MVHSNWLNSMYFVTIHNCMDFDLIRLFCVYYRIEKSDVNSISIIDIRNYHHSVNVIFEAIHNLNDLLIKLNRGRLLSGSSTDWFCLVVNRNFFKYFHISKYYIWSINWIRNTTRVNLIITVSINNSIFITWGLFQWYYF